MGTFKTGLNEIRGDLWGDKIPPEIPCMLALGAEAQRGKTYQKNHAPPGRVPLALASRRRTEGLLWFIWAYYSSCRAV